jgi:hypothetical protein
VFLRRAESLAKPEKSPQRNRPASQKEVTKELKERRRAQAASRKKLRKLVEMADRFLRRCKKKRY